MEHASTDRRPANYLSIARHYEFGPPRQPINLSSPASSAVLSAWRTGDELRCFAMIWAEVYGQIQKILAPVNNLAEQIPVVRCEDQCLCRHQILGEILNFVRLNDLTETLLEKSDNIGERSDSDQGISNLSKSVIRRETNFLAAEFGYGLPAA